MRGRLLKVLPLGVAFIGLGCILLTGGCSSGSARFRYVLGSTGAPVTSVDVDVDGKTVLNGISYGAAGTYKSSSSGSRQFEVFQTGTTTNPFFNGSVSLSSGDTTVISVNTFSTMAMTAFTDDNAAPTSGNVKLRFIHASPTAGGVDVYVIQPPNTIGGLSPQLTVQYKEASGYLSLTAGTYEVVMTQAGTQNPISGLDNTFSLTAGQVRTIVILDGPSGGGPYRQVILSDLN